ncbi:DUF2913 family protein [Shewanella psychropiezotolerans]|uniref:DUF2913 family protein n=1 Tax=Shewanella psychropiezotolerans TaxID=2593655 RepID=A0ABX5WZ95_9GAMM|nr:DUF2913 family protein [Shewanella psychropiezotolerans]
MINFSLISNLTALGIFLKNIAFNSLVSNLVDNALLHLYFSVEETSRLIPMPKRNEILVRYLKPKLKDNHYRQIKNELRSLLTIGRSAKGDLETKLLKVRKVYQGRDKRSTDVHKLFDLLKTLRCEQGLGNRLVNENNKSVPKFIYMLEENVAHGFNQAGEQIAPMSLFLESNKINSVIDVVERTGIFSAELQPLTEDTQQGHILLHPKN